MYYYVIIINIIIQTVCTVSGTNRPIVEVQEGKLRGVKEQNIDGNSYFYAFRGIPFAKPPIGDLRFKDPEPVEAWSSVRNAEKFSDVCAQIHLYLQQLIGSDDCLYLNVYTNNLNPKEPRAVMIWIPGGQFVWGSGNDDLFGSDYLVQKDIVLVTINYRLHIFGFLNLDDEDAPGNQGLKDMVLALKWVKQNIAKFGGDPNKVTIFGESAGAASVHYLTLSPSAEGLFHYAIMQSGVATNSWAYVSRSMKEGTINIAHKLGVKITDTKQLIEYLRNVDTYELIRVLKPIIYSKDASDNIYGPSIDSKSANSFLNISVIEAAKKGIKLPHIIGHTSHESIFFLSAFNEKDYLKIEKNQDVLMIPLDKREVLKKQNVTVSDVKHFFMGDKKISKENAQLFSNFATAGWFIFNIQDIIETNIKVSNVTTYYYKFDYYNKESAVMQHLLNTSLAGTTHSEDVFYLFNAKLLDHFNIKRVSSYSTERIIQKRFLELWTNFAKTGNPNLGNTNSMSIQWKPVNSSNIYNCLEISNDLNMIMEPNILNKVIIETKTERKKI